MGPPGHLYAVWAEEPWTDEDVSKIPEFLASFSKMMENVINNAQLCLKLLQGGAAELLLALIQLPTIPLTNS